MALWDKKETKVNEPDDEKDTPPAMVTATEMTEDPNVLVHRLPIRDNLNVEITLPRDLTQKEVQRITRWLQAIALTEEPPALKQGPGM